MSNSDSTMPNRFNGISYASMERRWMANESSIKTTIYHKRDRFECIRDRTSTLSFFLSLFHISHYLKINFVVVSIRFNEYDEKRINPSANICVCVCFRAFTFRPIATNHKNTTTENCRRKTSETREKTEIAIRKKYTEFRQNRLANRNSHITA